MAISAALFALIGASGCISVEPGDARPDGGEVSSQGDEEGDLDPEGGDPKQGQEQDTEGDEGDELGTDTIELIDLGGLEDEEGGSCEGQEPIPTDAPVASEPLLIDDISVEGDCLTIDVQYRGCELHAYEAYWDAKWTKSLPPQTTMYLAHQLNEGESTECGPVFDSWVVDISKLRASIHMSFMLHVGSRSVLVEG